MAVIPFREWVPDSADLGNPGSVSILNALPGATSYKPMSSYVSSTDALDARPRGAIEAKDAASNVYQYAGDETKLYSYTAGAGGGGGGGALTTMALDGGSLGGGFGLAGGGGGGGGASNTWTDVSKVGGYATGSDERWEFVRWKEQVIATNFSDDPQTITFGDTMFADLTTALRFRHVAVVKDFVVAGYTFDGTDGTVRDRVRWSAINDETDWTVSPTTLSDFRDLKGDGIQQIIGGEYGVILSEDSTYRMSFVGAPTVFQIDEVLPGVGSIAPGAAALMGGVVYFPSEHGFVALSGGTSPAFIGAGRVDQFFRNDLDESYLTRLSAVADPRSGVVFWAYPGSGNTSGRPNKILAYDTKLDRWSLINQELELIWRSGGVATTLEGLDSISGSIDDLGVSLDSSQWKGSAPLLSMFDSSYQSGNFSGLSMDATLETKEVELNSGVRTQLNSFVPLIDGGTTTARVRSRTRQTDSPTYTTSLSLSDSGRFTTRSNARYHSFEMTITGEWQDAIGVQVGPRDARKAQGRG